MRDRFRLLSALRRPAGMAVTVIAVLAWTIGAAWPQAANPPSPPAAAPPPAATQPATPDQPPPAPPEPENPGLIDEMGKALKKSLSILPPLKSPGETIDDLNARAKEAGESLSRLTNPGSMVRGRMQCPVATNGAADCKAAADKLCRSKGYKEGKSLGTDAVESCSPKVLIPGRARKPDDCRTDNYVTSALCQ